MLSNFTMTRDVRDVIVRAEAPSQMHDSYNATETGLATKLVGFSYIAI